MSSIEGLVLAAYSTVVPYLGDEYVDLLAATPGFDTKLFRDEDGVGVLTDALSKSSDTGSIIQIFSDSKKLAKFLTVLTFISTGMTLLDELGTRKAVAVDQIIDATVGLDLTADSHEKVAALYRFAKSEINGLLNAGKISYKQNAIGNVSDDNINFNREDIDNLSKNLQALKILLDSQ